MTTATQNAAMMNAIAASGNTYTVKKYAGAWVPAITVKGDRKTFAHCATSGGAMDVAIRQCAIASGWTA